jgi:amino acid adenylation domain-containing protein
LLGILKAGGAYVPFDPTYPPERLAFMLTDTQLPVLLTQEKWASAIPQTCALQSAVHNPAMVCLDTNWGTISQADEGNPATSGLSPEHRAYVIYTSGSTGKPKGVQISHQSLVNFLDSMRRKPGLKDRDTLLAVTTLSFDIAALELYLPLIVGACVVLASREVASDGSQLSRWLKQLGATVMQATPATWRILLAAGWEGNAELKILCGGEALPGELAERLLEKGNSLWNLYGPTETTVWSAAYEITGDCLAARTHDGPVSIGRPIANTQLHVLDRYLQPVPVGVTGELHIGGAGLARGYLDRPGLTAEKFVPNHFSDEPGTRLYKTGDLARYLPDGNIEFLGRIDHQVKVHGFRIELGEIEAVLTQYPGIRETVVLAREDEPGDKRLVAYLVPDDGQEPTAGDLRRFLQEKLPEYMIPSAFVTLEALPLTPNRKVDRRALPRPDGIRQETADYVTPRDEIEETLADLVQRILRVEPISVHDNFFRAGGNSLLMTQLFSQVNQTFKVEIPLQNLFNHPTVAGIAELVRAEKSRKSADETPIAERLGTAFPTEREGVLETYLRQKVARSLGIEVEQLPADGSLASFDLEMLAVDLILTLRRDLKLQLFVDEITAHPSIRELAHYVLVELDRLSNLKALATKKPLSAYTLKSYRAHTVPRPLTSSPVRKNKPMVFLLSSPRAGSTLLRVMLAGHPNIFCPPELTLLFFHDMQEWQQSVGSQGQGFQWPTWGLHSTLVELMGIGAKEGWALIEDMVAQNRSIQDVYAQLQELADGRLLIDKTPPYSLDMETLKRAETLFEAPKYIHLVRHPYSVIESILHLRADRLFASRLFEEDNVDPYVVAETVWALCDRNVLQFRKQIDPERYHLVRYEDLVSEPERVMTELCHFLGLPFDKALLNPYDGKRDRMMGGIGDPKVLQYSRVDAGRGEAWKKIKLPRPLDESTKELAVELGYTLAEDVGQPMDKPVKLDKLSDEEVTAMLGELLTGAKKSSGG